MIGSEEKIEEEKEMFREVKNVVLGNKGKENG